MRMSIVASAYLVLAFAALGYAEQEQAGNVIALVGKASALGADGKTRPLAVNSPVFMGDAIRTEKGAKLQIMLADETVMSQGELSELVIDEFVYDPKAAKGRESCGLRMTKGVFRVVTGKITEMNPERFKARTRMATIGIRGCEVGFRLRQTREDIYVMYLPEDRRILVEKIAAAAAQQQASEDAVNILNIARSGVGVTIEPGGALKERSVRTAEIRQLIQDSTPFSSGQGAGEGNLRNLEAEHEASLGEKADEAVQAGRQMGQAGALGQQLDNMLPPLPTGPRSGPEETLPPPGALPPVMVGGNPELSDWEWGIWENGDVEYNPNRYIGAVFLSDTEYSDIASGATTYDLAGTGEAGAVVRDLESDRTTTLQGTCNIDIHVGGAATPSWGGSFDLSNSGGETLSFSVDSGSGGGSIDSTGRLHLESLNSYSLNALGRSLTDSSLSRSMIEGRLINGPNGSPPITAVAGEFEFEHTGAARVNGAFGANFGPY